MCCLGDLDTLSISDHHYFLSKYSDKNVEFCSSSPLKLDCFGTSYSGYGPKLYITTWTKVMYISYTLLSEHATKPLQRWQEFF